MLGLSPWEIQQNSGISGCIIHPENTPWYIPKEAVNRLSTTSQVRTIDLNDPDETIAVEVGGISGTPDVKRVDMYGNELPLSFEDAGGGKIRVEVPVLDDNSETAAINDYFVTRTFYLVVESSGSIANGTQALQPGAYDYRLPADWAATANTDQYELDVANMYACASYLAVTQNDGAYLTGLAGLDNYVPNGRATTALNTARGFSAVRM